jgi:23S rRNA (cytosine1962-C5)-methyltransferase
LILLELKNEYDHLLINRIVKNYKHIRKWAKRNNTDCFRIYDRDIPEYPLSADYYAGKFIFQYYSRDDGDEVPGDLGKIIGEGIGAVFGAPAQDIFWKVRKKRALLEQYEKLGEEGKFFACEENGKKFYINLGDYLDSGLFLDHRSVREIAERMSHGKRVLNLFSYTSSFTVYSVAGGATGSVSVDMSNTYTAWAEKNFRLNGIDMKKHLLIREDCLKYLRTSYEKGEKFDLIIIDPPTISRSKKMDGIFDVNTGHAGLIINCSNLLRSKESVMLFSTNSRKFRMDEELNLKFNIDDISQKTIPEGFRDKKIHKVFLVKLK